MTKRTIDHNARPVGKRVRRAARVRRATVERIAIGRERATAAMLSAARARAIPVHMPVGLHTVRGVGDRAREWALNTAARLVARSIERSTWKAAFDRLEAMKIGGKDWKTGVWLLINVMKGNMIVD